MDMTNIDLEEESFDVVLDKGSWDSVAYRLEVKKMRRTLWHILRVCMKGRPLHRKMWRTS